MTDEELAEFLEYEVMRWPCCKQGKPAGQETGKCIEPDCRGCWLDWLKQDYITFVVQEYEKDLNDRLNREGIFP